MLIGLGEDFWLKDLGHSNKRLFFKYVQMFPLSILINIKIEP